MPPSTATLPSAQDALSAYNGYTPPSAQDVLTQSENKYGVNDLATRVNNLQTLSGNLTNAVAAVDPSVTARTAGSLVTEGQRSALVNRERQPILSDLNSNNQALTQSNDQLNTARGNAKDQANAILSDAQAKKDNLLQTYNLANAREAAQQAAAQQAAQQAEAVREYNQSRQDALSNAAANRATSAAPNATQQQQQHLAQIDQNLSKVKGKDGKVSEQSWMGAFSDAVAAGYQPEQVWQILGKYVNRKYANTYAGYVSGYGNKYTY